MLRGESSKDFFPAESEPSLSVALEPMDARGVFKILVRDRRDPSRDSSFQIRGNRAGAESLARQVNDFIRQDSGGILDAEEVYQIALDLAGSNLVPDSQAINLPASDKGRYPSNPSGRAKTDANRLRRYRERIFQIFRREKKISDRDIFPKDPNLEVEVRERKAYLSAKQILLRMETLCSVDRIFSDSDTLAEAPDVIEEILSEEPMPAEAYLDQTAHFKQIEDLSEVLQPLKDLIAAGALKSVAFAKDIPTGLKNIITAYEQKYSRLQRLKRGVHSMIKREPGL